MKRIVLAALCSTALISAASAADLAPAPAAYNKSPVVAAPPATNWSGFYAGLSAGYANTDASVLDNINDGVVPGPFGYHEDGFVGGGQLGYNQQFGWIVLGVEGDASYVNLSGGGVIGSAAAVSHQDLSLDSGFLGDITGRVGVAFGGFMPYFKGGYAYYSGSATQTTTNPGYVTTGTGSLNGWVIGGGLEYMLSPNWTIKGEYQHYDFGSNDGYQTNVGDLSSPIGYRFTNSTAIKLDTFKAGVNYRFN